MRTRAEDKSAALIVGNLHPSETMDDIRLNVPPAFPMSRRNIEEISFGFPATDPIDIDSEEFGPLVLPPLSVRIFRLHK